MYDRILAFPRLLKTAIALAQISLFYLSYKLLVGELDIYLVSGALAVSAFWLALTGLRLNGLLRTYFDHLSRLQVTIPCICGSLLAGLALLLSVGALAKVIAGLELAGWLAVYLAYRRNRANFIKQGHGPLPKETWVSPDAEALEPGDMILTSGQMAGRLHDSVGHAELVIPDEDGKLYALTSYMERGARYHRLDAVVAKLRAKNIHYIAIRLKEPLSPVQMSLAPQISRELIEKNRAWTKQSNEKRQRFISWLPLPGSFKNWLSKKTCASGYDWVGLFIGTRAGNRWTCIAICIECLHRLGVPVGNYGTGLLGLGTGLLDPIQPVRLLGDPAYRLVSLEDQRVYLSEKKN